MRSKRHAPLSEVVADSLRQSLKDGVYQCGERLAGSVIAREMNVSQNTARDALGLLEREGWLIKQARRGVTVREFTVDEALELYTLRATLEQLALDWASERLAMPHHQQLAGFISDARLHAGMGNLRGMREAIYSFHLEISVIAERAQTRTILMMLLNQCRLLENVREVYDPPDAQTQMTIIDDYGDLLTRLRYQDYTAARNTLFDIIMKEGRALLPVIDLILR